jgi:hypothetical protein
VVDGHPPLTHRERDKQCDHDRGGDRPVIATLGSRLVSSLVKDGGHLRLAIQPQPDGSRPLTKTNAAVTARSYHPGGVNCLCCDASVRFIKNSINWVTWRALGTIASGEVVSSDSF